MFTKILFFCERDTVTLFMITTLHNNTSFLYTYPASVHSFAFNCFFMRLSSCLSPFQLPCQRIPSQPPALSMLVPTDTTWFPFPQVGHHEQSVVVFCFSFVSSDKNSKNVFYRIHEVTTATNIWLLYKTKLNRFFVWYFTLLKYTLHWWKFIGCY